VEKTEKNFQWNVFDLLFKNKARITIFWHDVERSDLCHSCHRSIQLPWFYSASVNSHADAFPKVKSHFYLVLFTIQFVLKQLHSDNMKIIQHISIILLNIKMSPTKQAKSKATTKVSQEFNQSVSGVSKGNSVNPTGRSVLFFKT